MQSSDNIALDARKSGKMPLIEDFENTLKLRLNQDKPSGEEGKDTAPIPSELQPGAEKSGMGICVVADVYEQPGEIDAASSVPESQTWCGAGLQTGIVADDGQKQADADIKPVSNQLTQFVQCAPAPSPAMGVVATGDNPGQNAQQGVSQQIQVVLSQSNADQSAALTTAGGTGIQQGDEHPAVSKTEPPVVSKAEPPVVSEAEPEQIVDSPGADGGRLAGDAATIPPRFVDNAGGMTVLANPPQTAPDKPAEPANQQNRVEDTESAGLTNQPASVQSRVQLESLSVETVTSGGVHPPSSIVSSEMRDEGAGDSRTSASAVESHWVWSKGDARQSPGNQPGAGGLAEKLGIETVELFSEKNNSQKSDSSDGSDSGNGTPQFVRGQMTAFDTGEVVAGNRPIAADHNAAAAKNDSLPDTAAAIREQIYQSIQGSQQGSRQIVIQLNPPELGRVSIKFSERGNELTGLLEATNPQTRAEIRQAIPEIIRSLEQAGISIRRLDVTLSDASDKSGLQRQSAQQSFRDNTSQDLWGQSGQHAFQDAGGNHTSHDSFLAPTYAGDTAGIPRGTSLDSHQYSPSDLSGESDNTLDVLL